MRYVKNKRGYFLQLKKRDSGAFYDIVKNATVGVEGADKELNCFIKFIINKVSKDNWNNAFAKVWASNRQGEVEYNIFIVKMGEDEPEEILEGSASALINNITPQEIKELDADALYAEYEKFRENGNFDIKSKLVETGHLESYKEEGFYNRQSLQQNIYKISQRDIFTLGEYADYFFLKNGEYFIKAIPGAMLDDFYEKSDVREEGSIKISKDLAVQK